MTFREFFSSPWSNLISLMIGIVGTLLSYNGVPRASVSYQASVVKLIDSGQVGDTLTVFNKEGQKIVGNVYALDLVFWNSGNVLLGKSSDRLREPLGVALSPETSRILASTIQKQNFDKRFIKVQQNGPNQDKFDLDEFDPGDAFRILLLFEGTEDTVFSIAGKIGNGEIIDYSPPSGSDQFKTNGDYLVYGFNHNTVFRISILFIHGVVHYDRDWVEDHLPVDLDSFEISGNYIFDLVPVS
jgi:hypothetical protein